MSSRADRRWTRSSVLGLVVGVLVLLLLVGVVLVERAEDGTSAPTATPSYRDGRVVVSDTFERTLDAGWGSADVGGAYQVVSEPDFEVADGVGLVNLPRPSVVHEALLSEARPQDLVVSVDVIAPQPVTRGSGVYVALHLRANEGFYYRPVLRFAADQKVYLSIARFDGSAEDRLDLAQEKTVATGVEAGTRLTLRVSLTGVTPVRMVASVTDGTKPAVSVEAEDATASRLATGGAFALWAYVAGSSDADKVVGFDNLNVAQQVSDSQGAGDGAGSIGGAAAPGGAGGATGGGDAGTDPVGGQPRGSVPVGDARYDVPAGAVFVAPEGSDSDSGSLTAPYASIQRAVDAAPAGGTVVLRAGSYHQSAVLPITKTVDLQAYPGEAVWLDGSSVVRGWRRAGRVWQVPWTTFFDSSPTYTQGAEDRDEPGWRFLDPAHPMAAHPDQVWVDGAAQTQVARRSQVTDGTFFVDEKSRRLVLGTKPTGTTVRASTLDKALTVVGSGDRVRGIGVRRYATSVWQLGAVTVNNTGVSVENVVLEDNATTGLSVFAADGRLSGVTAVRNGLMGLHANQADGLQVEDVVAAHNNLELFNRAPAAGGMKLTSSHRVRIADSAFTDNNGHGLWFDSSSYDVDVVGSRAERNTGAGIVIEISSRVRLVNDVLLDNGLHGLWVINTDRVEVANNSFGRNAESNLVVVTDGRDPTTAEPGDRPRASGDPSMTWITRDVRIYNNVFADGGARCVVCVLDYTGTRTGAELGIAWDHNYYAQRSSSAPAVFATWPSGQKNPSTFGDFDAYRAGTGQDRTSVLVDSDTRALDRYGRTGMAVTDADGEVARGLGGPALEAVGADAPTRPVLGAWQ